MTPAVAPPAVAGVACDRCGTFVSARRALGSREPARVLTLPDDGLVDP